MNKKGKAMKRKFTHFVGHCKECGRDFPVVAECSVCDDRLECLLKIRPSCVPDMCYTCHQLYYCQPIEDVIYGYQV